MRKRHTKPTLAKHQPLTIDIDAELERLSGMKSRREQEQLKDKLGLEVSVETIIKALRQTVADLKKMMGRHSN